jgi:DNA-directed RNA polymerase subunit RPC12/RpoP
MALRRTPLKRKKSNKKAQTERNKKLATEYGMKLKYWRYNGRKGIYWALLSEFVRKRDLNKFGECISCGNPFTDIKQVQAGHYAPAGNCGFKLLFDLRNVNAECPKCNNPLFSPGKLIQYRANLVKRYGERWVKKLDKDYTQKEVMKEWTQLEYDKEIKKLQRKIKKLDEEISKEL